MLLTERAAHLKDHAGQISLPGGRLAPGETPAAAALREAHEEVGLLPDSVTVLGTLDPLLTGTGFTVTPVVGVVTRCRVRARARSARSRRMCSSCRSSWSSHPSGITVGYFERHGARLKTYELHYDRFRIWGATAAILQDFREVLLDERPT